MSRNYKFHHPEALCFFNFVVTYVYLVYQTEEYVDSRAISYAEK